MYHSHSIHSGSVALLSVLVTLAPTASVRAQEPAATLPRIEIGLDAAVAAPGVADQARPIVAPRLTMNLSPRTAVNLSGDVFTTRDYVGESWGESRVVMVEMQRGLWRTGRFALSGVTGGGFGWSRFFTPEYTYLTRNEPVIVPANIFTSQGPEFSLGVGAEQRLSPRLALRQEAKVVLGDVAEFRAQIGVTVPIGRYSPQFEPLRTRSGHRPDSLGNGTGIGAIVGAAAMTGFVVFLANALCDGDCEDFGTAAAVGATYGAGAGALIGAITDSFIE